MFWLLPDTEKNRVRNDIELLTKRIATLTGNPSQADQLFPFVGRKDLRKASAIIDVLLPPGKLGLDPFSGSGIFAYAAALANKNFHANEWDPYTWRMSSAAWRTPTRYEAKQAFEQLADQVENAISSLYGTICNCGNPVVVDSFFFDREPLRYQNVTAHERLGKNGETVTYRQKYKCRRCGRGEKHFGDIDQERLRIVSLRQLSPFATKVFNSPLIENSRININKEFTRYGNFFPYRSQVALDLLWSNICNLDVNECQRDFLKDAFLAIIPQAKYKDYRSKSQDLHVPKICLREVNIWFRFSDTVEKRLKRLSEYGFDREKRSPIACEDFREFLKRQKDGFASLVFTDPPWTDGNAYFEKSQLYHPWLEYSLSADSERLEKEVVVSDAPSRSEHDEERWWEDISDFFKLSAQKTTSLGYLAVYFRPIPASRWLQNLNRLKFIGRKAGYEPLLTIDAASKDPSMRIQQSASFVFSTDLVFVFLRLPEEMRRVVFKDQDLDYFAFKAGSELQQELRSPFLREEWDRRFYEYLVQTGTAELSLPKHNATRDMLFDRYMREIAPNSFLVKPDTPFNGQLFDIPAQERLFSYVPSIVEELTRNGNSFTYDEFLLKLAAYVENGTRMLIQSIEKLDVKALLRPYAEVEENGNRFRKREVPDLSRSVTRLHELDPYEFERFTAKLLEAQGFSEIAIMGGSGDRGVDVVALSADGKRTVVQCKRYLNNVAADPIQRLHSFAVTRRAERKIVITTAGFTRHAIEEAHQTDTELIDGDQLARLVDRFMPDFLRDDD